MTDNCSDSNNPDNNTDTPYDSPLLDNDIPRAPAVWNINALTNDTSPSNSSDKYYYYTNTSSNLQIF